jgi:hypothetical protein
MPSNLPARHQLAQQGIHARLPARTAAAKMLHGFGIEPDFHFDLWRIQLGPSAPGGLHSRQEGRIQWRIVVVNFGIKLDSHNIIVHPLNVNCKPKRTSTLPPPNIHQRLPQPRQRNILPLIGSPHRRDLQLWRGQRDFDPFEVPFAHQGHGKPFGQDGDGFA